MEQFLIQYGLWAVFCCAVVENDVTFALAGVVVHLGFIHPVGAVIFGVLGALIHDSFWYWIGRTRSETIRASRVYRKVGPAIERLADRFGPWELFFCRFVYGTRSPSLIFWGIHGLDFWRFLFIEIIALSIWGTLLTTAGYVLSTGALALIGQIKSMERWVIIAFVIVVGGVFLARGLTRYEIKKHFWRPR